jgi:hypothetical protein
MLKTCATKVAHKDNLMELLKLKTVKNISVFWDVNLVDRQILTDVSEEFTISIIRATSDQLS